MDKSRFLCFLFEKDFKFCNSETVHGKDKASAQPNGPEVVIPGFTNDDGVGGCHIVDIIINDGGW